MRISLDRKKLLLITFFLCCILPAYFKWFALESGSSVWSGMLIARPLFLATVLFAFALLFARFQYTLSLGVAAHLLLIASCLNCLFSFTLLTGISDVRDVALSLTAATPMYWVSLGLEVFHLALFSTTEIAYQRLKKAKNPSGAA